MQTKNLSLAVTGLIAVNVLLFVITFLLPGNEQRMNEWLALYFPMNELFQPWQFATHMFMHGGFAHILFNMFALFMFGTPLERIWGSQRFLVFFFLSGFGAGLIYTAINFYQFQALYDQLIGLGLSDKDIGLILDTGQTQSSLLSKISREDLSEFFTLFHAHVVGASGAVYGILVAFGIMYPNAKLALIFLPVPVAAKYFIPALLLLDLFSGVTGFSLFGGGIAHFAHIGGAIIGFCLMLLWRKSSSEYSYVDYRIRPSEER